MEYFTDFGTIGIIAFFVYLVILIAIGFIAKKKQKSSTLSEFFLSGRRMGIFVLFFTLYATQYSGNSFSAFAGKAYQTGFLYLIIAPCILLAPILGYALFAKKLHILSKEKQFITIGDFIYTRFKSRMLTLLTMLALVFALAAFILSNLKAVGYIVETISNSRISATEGIIILAVVMVIYESLGGLRSVAWTDVIQGILILGGGLFLLIFVFSSFNGFHDIHQQLLAARPNFWALPKLKSTASLTSIVVLAFFGISIYPQAIQRIYAAKNVKTLKRSIQFMAIMPFLTTVPLVLISTIGIIYFHGLSKTGSEKIIFLMLQRLSTQFPFFDFFIILFLIAVTAAIMSTVDSILLAIASLFTKDICTHLRPDLSEKSLTHIGKVSSWIIMTIAAVLAIMLPQTLWRLLEIKLDVISQVAPAIFLGIRFKSIEAKSILYGFIAGMSVVLILF